MSSAETLTTSSSDESEVSKRVTSVTSSGESWEQEERQAAVVCYKTNFWSKRLFRSHELILRGFSLSVNAGEIVGILGGSSSGKSMVLQTMAGRAPRIVKEGTFEVNATPSYCSQENDLIGDLLVSEVFSDALRLRRGLRSEELENELNALSDGIGLRDYSESRIGTVLRRGLSGGQQRRVQIGLELAGRPALCLLDEPTSGLDATTALSVINYAKSLCRNHGLAAIVTLHQPNATLLKTLDRIVILGQGGMVFNGTYHELIEYVITLAEVTDLNINRSPANAVEELLRLSAESTNVDLVSLWDGKTSECGKGVGQFVKAGRSGIGMEVAVLLQRQWRLVARDITFYVFQVTATTLFGIVVGASYFQIPLELGIRMFDLPATVCWMILPICYLQVFGLYHINKSTIRHRAEYANGFYRGFSNWLAETITVLLCHLAFPIIGMIPYGMAGLDFKVYPFFALCIYVMGISTQSALCCTAQCTEKASVTVLLGMVQQIIGTLFCGGLFLGYDAIPNYWLWLQYVTHITYPTKAAMLHLADSFVLGCGEGSRIVRVPQQGVFCTNVIFTFPCDKELSSTFIATRKDCVINGNTMIPGITGMVGVEVADKWLWILGGLMFFVIARLILLALYIKEPLSIIYTLSPTSSIPEVKPRVEIPQNAKTSHSTEEVRMPSSLPLVFKDFNVFRDATRTQETRIVRDVSGYVQPGRILALLGPSGSGKTTLLSAVARRTSAQFEGSATMGASRLETTQLGWVEQFPTFSDEQTAMHVLSQRAKYLRGTKFANETVSGLLEILGLTHKAKSRVKTMTGGERKRLAIGRAMCGGPQLLFLDECTTGLDSAAAFSLVSYILRVVKQQGIGCIMTIHQPSAEVFAMLQDVMILSQNGRVAFQGKSNDLGAYLGQRGIISVKDDNMSDVALLALATKSPTDIEHEGEDLWHQSWARSTEYEAFVASYPPDMGESCRVTQPSGMTKFLYLLCNTAEYAVGVSVKVAYQIVLLLVLALFVGTMFYDLPQDTKGLVMTGNSTFFAIWLQFFSMLLNCNFMVTERRAAVDDILSGAYSAWARVLATFLVSVPINLFLALVFQCGFHFLTGAANGVPNPDTSHLAGSDNPYIWAFGYAVLISASMLLVMEGCLAIMVDVWNDSMLASTSGMVFMGMFFLFAGYTVRSTSLSVAVKWISWIVPTRYAFAGYLIALTKHQVYEAKIGPLTQQIEGPLAINIVFGVSEDLLSWGSMSEEYAHLLCTLCFVVGIRIIQWGVLELILLRFRK